MSFLDISDLDVVRAWKDEEYRRNLSAEQKALLPHNPAGEIDLSYEAAGVIKGGYQYPLYTENRCLTLQGTPSLCGGGCISGFTKSYAGC